MEWGWLGNAEVWLGLLESNSNTEKRVVTTQPWSGLYSGPGAGRGNSLVVVCLLRLHAWLNRVVEGWTVFLIHRQHKYSHITGAAYYVFLLDVKLPFQQLLSCMSPLLTASLVARSRCSCDATLTASASPDLTQRSCQSMSGSRSWCVSTTQTGTSCRTPPPSWQARRPCDNHRRHV
jgi:hypothetical protein